MLNQRYGNNSYKFLRLLLALIVLVSHVLGLSAGFETVMIGEFSLGTLAVYCLFSISGYLVIRGLIFKGIREFLIKRFTRIYPGYILMMFLTGVIFYPIWRMQSQTDIFDWHTSIRYFFNNIVLVPQSAGDVNSSWNSLSGYPFKSIHPSVVNGSIWTLPFEVALYFLLCFLFLLKLILKRYEFKMILILSLSMFWILSMYSAVLYPELYVNHTSKIEQILTKWPYFLAFITGATMRVFKFKKISVKNHSSQFITLNIGIHNFFKFFIS